MKEFVYAFWKYDNVMHKFLYLKLFSIVQPAAHVGADSEHFRGRSVGLEFIRAALFKQGPWTWNIQARALYLEFSRADCAVVQHGPK